MTPTQLADAVAEVARLKLIYVNLLNSPDATNATANAYDEYDAALNALDWPAIVDALRANEWVSVKKRKPEPNEQVIAYGPKLGQGMFPRRSPAWRCWDVTHWKPLCAPPSAAAASAAAGEGKP